MVDGERKAIKIRPVDLDHVESKVAVPMVPENPIRTRAKENVFLSLVDAEETRRTYSLTFVRLDFNENKILSIA